ncbi:MAG: FtsQ-type POTRA domain-containing protein [Gemmatimonadota bacterium]|nr:FtsQ-type POTRA domain-containing protein [Gemmatimonadota bacterium]
MRITAGLTRRRVLLAGAVAALAATSWFGGPPFLRKVAFFEVRRVEVLGTRYLAGDTIVTAMALLPRASVFDPVEPLEARVFALIGVREVAISRRLPGTLRVWIQESEPVALSPDDGRLVLVDERGWVLPFDPTRFPADLPIAPADPGVAGVLARVRQADPGLFAALLSGAREQDHVVLETADRRLLLEFDASTEVIQDMMAVAQNLTRLGRTYRELDGRFAGRVYVRGIGS